MSGTSSSAAGDRFFLHHGDYAAEVVQAGATLRRLTHAGRDLILPFDVDEVRPDMRGAVLQPWPNRLEGAHYRFDGEDHRLPWTEPDRGNAIHGLVSWLAYTPVARSDDHLLLAAELMPQPGYPFALRSELDYRLDDTGLTIEVAARNVGNRVAPYGAGLHPYLVGGPGCVDDWELTLVAGTFTVAAPPRYLPGPRHQVPGSDADFRTPRRVGDQRLGHAFSGLHRDGDGWAEARVCSADGGGVLLRCDAAADWLLAFSYDLDFAVARTGLAVEPMTCPANAFITGEGLVRLEPGERHAFRGVLSAIVPHPA